MNFEEMKEQLDDASNQKFLEDFGKVNRQLETLANGTYEKFIDDIFKNINTLEADYDFKMICFFSSHVKLIQNIILGLCIQSSQFLSKEATKQSLEEIKEVINKSMKEALDRTFEGS